MITGVNVLQYYLEVNHQSVVKELESLKSRTHLQYKDIVTKNNQKVGWDMWTAWLDGQQYF